MTPREVNGEVQSNPILLFIAPPTTKALSGQSIRQILNLRLKLYIYIHIKTGYKTLLSFFVPKSWPTIRVNPGRAPRCGKKKPYQQHIQLVKSTTRFIKATLFLVTNYNTFTHIRQEKPDSLRKLKTVSSGTS